MDDSQKQERFAQLSPDDKLKIIGPQLDLYASAVSRKMATLPSIAALAATLIVLSTLNKNLVPLTDQETKVVLSILLFLIPLSLHIYIKDVEGGAKNALKAIKSYHKEDIFKELENQITFKGQFISDFPIVVTYIFYGIILLVIFRIWFLS